MDTLHINRFFIRYAVSFCIFFDQTQQKLLSLVGSENYIYSSPKSFVRVEGFVEKVP